MSDNIGKISVRQAFLLFIVLFCTPAIRYTALYTSEQAKQAAWLSPLISFVFMLVYMFMWCKILKKYEKKSFLEIINDIIGKIFGSILGGIYFLWITFTLVYNIRMYVQRITGNTMPNVSNIVILGIMLIIVGYIIKHGIIPLSKMNEIFFAILSGVFILYNILVSPEINISNLFPITYKDALPVFKANLGIVAIFSYNVIIFMFNDMIDHKGEFKKLSIMTVIILTVISLLLIIMPLCIFGSSILVKLTLPYIDTMMQISLFGIIERVESGIVMFWIITDFILISVFLYSAIHMIKISFKLSNVKPLITIYLIGLFFLSMALSQSSLELKILSGKVITPMNLVMGYILPILIFGVGKIRKKI